MFVVFTLIWLKVYSPLLTYSGLMFRAKKKSFIFLDVYYTFTFTSPKSFFSTNNRLTKMVLFSLNENITKPGKAKFSLSLPEW